MLPRWRRPCPGKPPDASCLAVCFPAPLPPLSPLPLPLVPRPQGTVQEASSKLSKWWKEVGEMQTEVKKFQTAANDKAVATTSWCTTNARPLLCSRRSPFLHSLGQIFLCTSA